VFQGIQSRAQDLDPPKHVNWALSLDRPPGIRYFGHAKSFGPEGEWLIMLGLEDGNGGIYTVGQSIREYKIVEFNFAADYVLFQSGAKYFRVRKKETKM
jgi:hypothetical protein